MSLLIEWACFRLVMLWHGAWPANAAANWILARAGRFAHRADSEMENQQ